MGKGNDEAPKSTTTTAIGPTIVIKGKLKSDEDLIVKAIRQEHSRPRPVHFVTDPAMRDKSERIGALRPRGRHA